MNAVRAGHAIGLREGTLETPADLGTAEALQRSGTGCGVGEYGIQP
jgi:hypothetical protein